MTAYTDEELLAVARVVWPGGSPLRHVGSRPGELGATHEDVSFWLDVSRHALEFGSGRDALEFAVRLALAHPERAGEALGPGWSIDGSHFNWRSDTTPGLFLRVAEGVVQLSAWCAVIPPEFDAALQRARLIAAAWQRIEASRG